MARRNEPVTLRARDPGKRLAQYGRVTWVHCPECDNAAKNTAAGVDCRHCGYMTIGKPYKGTRWARIAIDDPRCTFCRLPLDTKARPTARWQGSKQFVRVQCDHCGKVVDYPGRYGWPPQGHAAPRTMPLFLTIQVAGQTLWVDNLAHLDALEEYLSALVRERGPVAGLTMMARLPPWLKSAGNRPKVIRALRQLRERANKAGIDE